MKSLHDKKNAGYQDMSLQNDMVNSDRSALDMTLSYKESTPGVHEMKERSVLYILFASEILFTLKEIRLW